MNHPILPACPVSFNQAAHTYTTPDGLPLSGVTAMLDTVLFPDRYADVDADTLERARQRGTAIHEKVELYHSAGIFDQDPDVKRYITALDRDFPDRAHVYTEYLVSDLTHIASSIDLIYLDAQGRFHICDLKTTYALDIPYVTWQLSVYAYLFRRQTGLDIASARVFWLPRSGAARLVTLRLYSEDQVRALIDAYINSTEFIAPDDPNDTALAYAIDPDIMLYQQLRLQQQALDAQIRALAPRVIEKMQQAYTAGVFSLKFCSEDGSTANSLSFTPASTRQSFDSKAFAADHPELYQQYIKTSQTKPSLRFT